MQFLIAMPGVVKSLDLIGWSFWVVGPFLGWNLAALLVMGVPLELSRLAKLATRRLWMAVLGAGGGGDPSTLLLK